MSLQYNPQWIPDGLGNVIPVGSLVPKIIGAVTSVGTANSGAVFESGIVSKVNSDSPYTVGAAVRYVNCDCTNGAITVNLPAATGSGRTITIKKTDVSTNVPTITRAASDVINGAAIKTVFNQYGAVTVHDAAAGVWFIISNPIPYDNGSIIVSKAASTGIKVDTESPTWGWKDLIGPIHTRVPSAGADPVSTVYGSGAIRQYLFNDSDEVMLEFHIPHDYVPGTDMYIHMHWSHTNSSNLTSGGYIWSFDLMYAKGYSQASFAPTTPITVTAPQTAIFSAAGGAFKHMIAETIMSSNGGTGGTLLNSSLFEVDGVILVRAWLSANSTSTKTQPFGHYCDVHYQSTLTGTKQRNGPNFYT